MATVTYAYTPANGSILDYAAFNGNLLSLTSGVSLYGELNGGIESANLVAGFKVQPGMVRPGDSCATAMDGWTGSQTIGDRIFNDDSHGTSDGDWISVATASTRIFLDRDHPFVVYTVSAFISYLRQRSTPDLIPAAAVWSGPEIDYRICIDGVGIPHSRRSAPFTWYPANNPAEAVRFVPREQVLCRWICQSHLATGGSHTNAGWHDVTIEVFMPRNNGVESLAPMNRQTASAADVVACTVQHRITLGNTSAQAVAL